MRTRNYSCLTELYDQANDLRSFGKNYSGFQTQILFNLTARSLAYWAMDDGAKAKSGFNLHTPESASRPIPRFWLVFYIIILIFFVPFSYMKKNSLLFTYPPTFGGGGFRSLVTPYFHYSMLSNRPIGRSHFIVFF